MRAEEGKGKHPQGDESLDGKIALVTHMLCRLTRRSSATAGGSELSQHRQLSHKITVTHRGGQRLARVIG